MIVCQGFQFSAMITVDEAIRIVLDRVSPLGSETIDLERRDGLLIEPGAAIAVRSADQSGQFFIVTFDRG